MCRNKIGISERLKLTGIVYLLLMIVLFLASAKAPAGVGMKPDQITLSWTDDPTTSQTIVWRGSSMNQNKVQYLPAEHFKGRFSKAAQQIAAITPLDNDAKHFEVTLSPLMPGTQYTYRVGTEGAWSKPLNFMTAPETNSFSFLYMGDVQAGYEQWGETLHEAYKDNPTLKFALMGGDLVNDGEDRFEWAQFLQQTRGVFDCIPLMPALGNHDDTKNTYYLQHFALPQNGPLHLKERFYSFDYGHTHFTVLDSNRMGSEGPLYNEGIEWLKRDLSSSSKKWKIVMFHHPPYPAYTGKERTALLEKWVPVLEQNSVDLVLVGHQHVYMRTHPMYQGKIRKDLGRGIVYVMGNGGAKHYTLEPLDYIAASDGSSNYQVISMDGDKLTLTAKNVSGKVIDTYTIDKRRNINILPAPCKEIMLNMVNMNARGMAEWLRETGKASMK